jgi:predicted TIM-barrel fold metal-dependent hydrolase
MGVNGQSSGPEVIDFHCHVPSVDYVPAAFREATVETVMASLRDRGAAPGVDEVRAIVEGHLADPDCEQLLATMDRVGISRAVLIVPDFTWRLGGDGPTIEEQLARVAAITAAHPTRFSAMAGVDPRWGDDGVALFERALTEWRYRGFKVYPPCGQAADDRAYYPYYELCAAHGVPVMVHTGGSASCLAVEPGRPLHVDGAAADFGGVNFVLAHGCANLFDETVTLCTFRPNVYVDTSAVPVRANHLFEEAVRRGIGHKMVYGSDWPVFHTQGGLAGPLRRLRDPEGPLRELPAAQFDAVFGGRAAGLLGLPVAADRAVSEARA